MNSVAPDGGSFPYLTVHVPESCPQIPVTAAAGARHRQPVRGSRWRGVAGAPWPVSCIAINVAGEVTVVGHGQINASKACKTPKIRGKCDPGAAGVGPDFPLYWPTKL